MFEDLLNVYVNFLFLIPVTAAYQIQMDFMANFTMGTGRRYITILPADWSISTSHDPLPSSCHSEKILWNPSIQYQFALCCRVFTAGFQIP